MVLCTTSGAGKGWLAKADQALIYGVVLNKFRGDARLLSAAPEHLFTLTGIPTVATLPFWREYGLPEEDGLADCLVRNTDHDFLKQLIA